MGNVKQNMEELTQSLLLELESTRLRAQEEIKFRDNQFAQLKDLLNRAIRERDEAKQNCQKLIFEKLLLQNQLQNTPLSALSSIEDEPIRNLDSQNGFSSSDCEESIVSSPVLDPIPPPPPVLVPEKELPERGKFLEAVVKAGPLLGSLLLAGPLPQWRHPPPPLDSRQIPPPPVAVPPPAVAGGLLNCDRVSKKRGLCEGCDSSMDTKYPRIFPN
ncbi:hypothetical protein LguiA_012317 [Lonicera macranthoides]